MYSLYTSHFTSARCLQTGFACAVSLKKCPHVILLNLLSRPGSLAQKGET